MFSKLSFLSMFSKLCFFSINFCKLCLAWVYRFMFSLQLRGGLVILPAQGTLALVLLCNLCIDHHPAHACVVARETRDVRDDVPSSVALVRLFCSLSIAE